MNCRLLEAALKLLYQEQTSGPAISLTKPTPTLKQSFRSVYTTPMFGSCERSKTHWPASGRAHSACARPANNPSQERDSKPCPGHTSAASVRSDSTHSSVEEIKIMRAYILVNAKMGKVRDVAQKIASLAGVKMANACWGVPDIFVVVEVANADELNKLVIDKIQALEGVERTETHIAIE